MSWRISIYSFFVFVAFFAAEGQAASIQFFESVSPKSVARLKDKVERALSSGNREIVIALESEGGEVPAAIQAAKFLRGLRSRGVRVVTRNVSFCESSCTIIYAAGQKRMASGDATFYFHQVGVSGDVSSARREQIRQYWASAWLNEIRQADPRMASELESAKILQRQGASRTYYASSLRKAGYNYITD